MTKNIHQGVPLSLELPITSYQDYLELTNQGASGAEINDYEIEEEQELADYTEQHYEEAMEARASEGWD